MLTPLLAALALAATPAEPPPLNVLFLGDPASHHKPADRFAQLAPALAKRNVRLTYTDKMADLNPANLAKYDVLAVYANIDAIAPEQEKALLDYVAGGKGFVPLHCASYCFRNSDAYVKLVGAQFRSHTTGTFRVTPVAPEHPILQGYGGFESWDETYVHTKHNAENRVVLEERREGDVREPWTWVRTHGKGRVFYTAWGHDHRTFGNPGFVNLVERGLRWAAGQDPAAAGPFAPQAKAAGEFEYVEAKIPHYVSGHKLGAPLNTMQKPLDPAKSRKHYVVPEGFVLKPWADESILGGKPITMAWDERGRLWLALTRDYPNERQPDGEGRDKIVVCEDRAGKGVCDTVTVFAEKLSIPTSVLPYAGGLIVHEAPNTLFLKDTDGDGRADLKQVLFAGWGTSDTHAGPSNLRLGVDNWVYGAVGYAAFKGDVGGESHNFRQGFYRFQVKRDANDPHKLSVPKLEFLRSTSNNTWGLGFSEEGELFGSTANGCPLVHAPVMNRYYEKVRGLNPGVLKMITPDYHYEPITDKVRQVDWHGGFTAAAGCSVYTARSYPSSYWNRKVFVTEPTGHLAATFDISRDGAAATAKLGANLAASDDEWAAPIEALVGPDGHVWMIDWYNFIVQHNPTPAGFTTGKGNAYETPLRDTSRGRIYRIEYVGATPEPKLDVTKATPAELVAALAHPNMGWRLFAQYALVARGKTDVVPELLKLLAASKPDAAGVEPAAVHVAGVLEGLGATGAAAKELREKLSSGSASARVALIRILPRNEQLADVLKESGALTSDDARVRLACTLALAEAPATPAAALHLAGLIRGGADLGAEGPNKDGLLIAAGVNDAGVLEVLTRPGSPAGPAAPAVAEFLAQNLARKGWDAAWNRLLPQLAATDAPLADAAVRGALAGWRTGNAQLSDEAGAALKAVLAKSSGDAQVRALQLARAWGLKGLDAEVSRVAAARLAVAADTSADPAARAAAARQAVEIAPDDASVVTKILALVSTSSDPAFAGAVVDAAGRSKAADAATAVVAKLPDLSPQPRQAALRLILSRPDASAAFLKAVEAGKARFDQLALDQKTALASHPDAAIAALATKLLKSGGGLPDANRQKVIDSLAKAVMQGGDVPLGKAAFVQHCAKCHRHGGEGQMIGPDLTGMATHPREELLIHILDPSRSVEANFRTFVATTLDGRVITGLLAGETKASVELLDAENKRHPVARDDLEALRESPKSLMPEGFEAQMKPEQLRDLLAFLTNKGKFTPLPIQGVATVSTARGMFFDPEDTVGRMEFKDYGPKTFNGVPFALVDPRGGASKNAVMLHSRNGTLPPTMPRQVSVPVNGPVKALHVLGGVGGWAAQGAKTGDASLIVRFRYADGKSEDHVLTDGVELADYIRRYDVPGSQFAFDLAGRQVRYLSVPAKRPGEVVATVELVKGRGAVAPVVMALTAEAP